MRFRPVSVAGAPAVGPMAAAVPAVEPADVVVPVAAVAGDDASHSAPALCPATSGRRMPVINPGNECLAVLATRRQMKGVIGV